MVQRGQVRASGEPTANEVTKEVSEQFDQLVQEDVLPDEREKRFRTPGFTRMRTEWRGEDRKVIQRARDVVEARILREFWDAYEVMYRVYDLVRTPEVDGNGEVVRDRFGLVQWRRTPDGSYEEDFSRLTRAQKENLLFLITTRIFEWEQRAAAIWAEAMLSKAQWEERFSIGFDAPMSGTVDDRRAAGNLDARDERYFAILQSFASRKAEALVRSLTLLSQRLRDSLSF